MQNHLADSLTFRSVVFSQLQSVEKVRVFISLLLFFPSVLLVTTGKIQVTGAAPHVDRGQHKLLGNQGEAPTFQPQELTITRCHL